jgi:hypothetical protein
MQVDLDVEKNTFILHQLNALLFQHLFGGFFLVSILFASPGHVGSVVAAMGRHGALHECGHEIMDTLRIVYKIAFGTPEEKKVFKGAFSVVLMMHHTLGLCMIIPMNVYYGDQYWYLYCACILQFVAAVAMFLQQWGYTINAKTHLTTLQLNVTVSFLIMVYGRVYAWSLAIYNLLPIFKADSLNFYYAACVLCAIFSLFNFLLLTDVTKKFVKFVFRKGGEEKADAAKKESAPVDEAIRRRKGSEKKEDGAVKKESEGNESIRKRRRSSLELLAAAAQVSQ